MGEKKANMPKLYIDEFVGISNRLEVLPLAFAIRQTYGHEIILDWHELDSFSVDDTRRGKVRILARLALFRHLLPSRLPLLLHALVHRSF